MTVRERLYAVALERGLRETTVRSYEVLLERLGLLDLIDPDLGYQPDGKRNPNAYRLCIDGQPVSEIDR